MSDDSKYLVIRPNNSSTDEEPGRNYIYLHLPNGSETRKKIAGFSYFGEVGGLKTLPPNEPYVVLNPPPQQTSTAAAEDETDPVDEKIRADQIRMTYAKWLDRLKESKINMSRIFVYIDVEPEHYPFARTTNGKKYILNQRNDKYFYRLKKYVELAAQRDIIVQITLAGVQTLRTNVKKEKDLWSFHPLKKENNTSNKYLETFPQGSPVTDGRDKFFIMQAPDAAEDTEPEWNYNVQSRTLDWILDATSGSWNVIYELFNEPPPNVQQRPARQWLVTTAKWLDERLRIRDGGVRKHLIALNAPDTYLDNKVDPSLNILRELLFDGNGVPLKRPLIDVFSFHGNQWGGDPALPGRTDAVDGHAPKKINAIKMPTIEAVNNFYNMQFDFGNGIKPSVKESKVAVIIDSDAHYRAQDSPDVYGDVVMNQLKLDYNHRWSEFWLSKSRLTRQLKELKLAIK